MRGIIIHEHCLQDILNLSKYLHCAREVFILMILEYACFHISGILSIQLLILVIFNIYVYITWNYCTCLHISDCLSEYMHTIIIYFNLNYSWMSTVLFSIKCEFNDESCIVGNVMRIAYLIQIYKISWKWCEYISSACNKETFGLIIK